MIFTVLWYLSVVYIAVGRFAHDKEFRWAASIQKRLNEHYCDGVVMIDSGYVMTACSAFDPKNFDGSLKSLEVVAGSVSFIDDSKPGKPWTGQRRKTEKVVLHPECKHEEKIGIWRKDIALIKLTEPFSLESGWITPMNLMERHEVADAAANKFDCTVVGWGYNPSGKSVGVSSLLSAFDVPLLTSQDCEKEHGSVDLDRICTNGNRSFCNIGGGLYYNFSIEVLGFTSWHLGCGNGSVSPLYFVAETVLPWIWRAITPMETTTVKPPNKASEPRLTPIPPFSLLTPYLTITFVYK